jgi:hypothetical protein
MKTMSKPRGRPFQRGNTASRGRPPGSRNPATVAAQRLFEEHAEALARKCIELADKGDSMAMRLAMERVLPPYKNTLVYFTMPPVKSLADLPKAADAILQAVAHGEISPAESESFTGVLEFLRRNLETVEVDKRLTVLQEARATKDPE